MVTASVPAGGCADLSRVGSAAPAAFFNANTTSRREIFVSTSIDVVRTSRKAKTYMLTVEIPNCNYLPDCLIVKARVGGITRRGVFST